MADFQKFTVVTSTGARGYVLRKARFLDRSEQNKVVLDDGSELVVPSDVLQIQPDGTFLLRNDDQERVAPSEAPRVGPQIEQQFDAPPASRMDGADARQFAVQAPTEAASADQITDERQTDDASRTTIAISSTDTARELNLDEQLFADEVQIERVTVNRIVDQAPQTRQEGDILIIPVLEEVLTVQKRLLLKEEVRVQRRRNEVRQPRRVVLSGNETRIIGSDGRDVEPVR